MPHFIALDIGNVCVSISPEKALAGLGFADRTEAAALIGLEHEFETGNISEQEFMRRALPLCGGISEERMREIFASILTAPVPGMNELVAELPGLGIQPVFFSDISTTHLTLFRSMFESAKFVPEGIYSFETGMMKPGVRMFEAFERRFGTPLLYTDDRAELIVAAEARGWNAWRFTGADDLRRILTGILKNKTL